MIIFSQLTAIIMLLALSAFFSGAETSLIRLSKIKIKHWIYSRSSNTEAWINWLSKPQELITTILVGNTFVNIFLSSLIAALATYAFKNYRREYVQMFAGLLALLLVLIFGEIVPKIFGRQNPERISSIALPFLFNLSKFMGTPLKNFMALLGNVLPIFRQPAPGRVSTLSLDEIRAILQDPASLKGLKKEQLDMMQKVLELHQRTVQEIMTPWKNIDFIAIEDHFATTEKIGNCIDLWVEYGHTRVPVVKGTPPQLIGYFFTKDLLSCAVKQEKIDWTVLQKWIRPLPNIAPNKKVSEVLDLCRFGFPVACVRDRFGFPLGLVTLEDILEEVVGEILDEYDLEEKENQKIKVKNFRK